MNNKAASNMYWHCIPIISEEGLISLHEVYFDHEGFIKWWAIEPSTPSGEDMGELVREASNLLTDAITWEPIHVLDLREGLRPRRRGDGNEQ